MVRPCVVMINPAAVPLTPRSSRMTCRTGAIIAPAMTANVDASNSTTSAAPGSNGRPVDRDSRASCEPGAEGAASSRRCAIEWHFNLSGERFPTAYAPSRRFATLTR
jgi:hypothetical protein